MNNGGGGIFRWLPGTKHEGMFERRFEQPNRTVVPKAMDALSFKPRTPRRLTMP